MKSVLPGLLTALLVSAPLFAAEPPKPAAKGGAEAKPAAAPLDESKVIYTLGVVMSNNLKSFRLSPAEIEILKKGLSDGLQGKENKADVEANQPRIQELFQQRSSMAAAEEKKASQPLLQKAAAEPGAQKRPSGLIYKEIKAGSGPSPKATDQVKVHYHGTLADGKVFDSSVQRGQPATFPLNQVIPCWTEGVQLMKVGGKAKLTCPSDIAYGDRGAPPAIKPGATLTFEVELLEIVK